MCGTALKFLESEGTGAPRLDVMEGALAALRAIDDSAIWTWQRPCESTNATTKASRTEVAESSTPRERDRDAAPNGRTEQQFQPGNSRLSRDHNHPLSCTIWLSRSPSFKYSP